MKPSPEREAAPPATVAGALQWAADQGLDRVDAHALLAHLLGCDRAWLIAHDTDALPLALAARFVDLCHARAEGVPVAYLLGEREFHGLRLTVSDAVLVPRPDTETLVDWALERLRAAPPDWAPAAAPRVLDLGTGSGAIALAIAHRHPAAAVTATDRSEAALAVARANAERLHLPVTFRAGHWWSALTTTEEQTGALPETPATAGRWQLIVSNPPYIRDDDPHLPALRHEPLGALVAGADGLDDLRTLITGAPEHLVAGGWLLLEHGYDQAKAVAALLRQAGFTDVQTRRDLGDQDRCTGGRWPG